MRFLRQYGTILFPILLILSMCVMALVSPSKTFSKTEKRYLAQLPPLSVENIATGTYRGKFETYYSDQFPLRDCWIYIEESTNTVIKQ